MKINLTKSFSFALFTEAIKEFKKCHLYVELLTLILQTLNKRTFSALAYRNMQNEGL